MPDDLKRTGPVTIEELQEIAEEAFDAAREENRRLGVPNSFVENGNLLFELPDGTITDVNPFAKEASAEPRSNADRGPEKGA